MTGSRLQVDMGQVMAISLPPRVRALSVVFLTAYASGMTQRSLACLIPLRRPGRAAKSRSTDRVSSRVWANESLTLTAMLTLA